MRRRIIIVSTFGLIALSTVFGFDELRTQEPRSIEIVVEALKNQESLCGRSLEVTYKRVVFRNSVEQPAKASVRYVRTPRYRFAENKSGRGSGWDGWRTVLILTSSYDRIAISYRTKQTNPAATGAREEGRVGTGIEPTLAAADVLDPVWYYGFASDKPLIDTIAGGSVTGDEDVDGHPCWKIEASANGSRGVETRVVWVDPNVGFLPRRMETRFADSTDSAVSKFNEYREVAAGVWYPMELVVTRRDAAGDTVESVSKADGVNVDKPIPDSELQVTFSSGARVMDMDSGTVIDFP